MFPYMGVTAASMNLYLAMLESSLVTYHISHSPLFFSKCIKESVHPKLIFHTFTTHHFADVGSGDIF